MSDNANPYKAGDPKAVVWENWQSCIKATRAYANDIDRYAKYRDEKADEAARWRDILDMIEKSDGEGKA